MYSKVHSAVVYGIDGLHVEIEVKLSKGLPTYQIVGLPDKTVRESKERIRSAIESLGISFPAKRITLNLIPAETPKDGSQLDLPMAVGILSALNLVKSDSVHNIAFFGELTLDGRLMPTPGILSMVSAVATSGVHKVVVPEHLKVEASMIKGVKCYGATNISEVYELLNSEDPYGQFTSYKKAMKVERDIEAQINFSDVIGQEMAKRALMVAAAGFHNILISGPPGSGKSMMMSAFQNILPEMSIDEAVEVRKIHSIRDVNCADVLSLTRPVRRPHHNVTITAMIGGGVKPKPGEMSMAHRGVLFLDELPEFKRETIEAMRQPLEDKEINLSRIGGLLTMPSNILFAATMNPCKCGYQFSLDRACTCTDREIHSYLGKLSGPILDRLDVLIEVQRVEDSTEAKMSTSTEQMGTLVKKAVRTQLDRYKQVGIQFNSELKSSQLLRYCQMTPEAENLLRESVKTFVFSKRVRDKILCISRTIADIDGNEKIEIQHIAEAVQYRMAESRLRRENI